MSTETARTVAHGDGIGPEIIEAALHRQQEAGARLQTGASKLDEKVYLRGSSFGQGQ